MKNKETNVLASDNLSYNDDYIMRPFSPSLSISHLDKSSFSFGGLLEIGKLVGEMTLGEDKKYSEAHETYDPNDKNHVYLQKVQEIQDQINSIKNLYEKEVKQHMICKEKFEKIVSSYTTKKTPRKNVNIDTFKVKHLQQMNILKDILGTVKQLEEKLMKTKACCY
ncbi:hypothetical protein SteCoe_33384 [Stentor coeruleus]|uniref:Uncharacterized protein n=1 Tax=Stentor coeruleus TaxID=5963 RepID=A0A1R2AX05_9CILI|nr:hypothetical protein SteCoe_33384 [Stentor coeruleus]